MSAVSRISTSIVELLRAWWNADRIRISPFEGRLQSLSVGQRVRIGDEMFAVVDRKLLFDDHGRRLRYRLHDGNNSAELCVPLGNNIDQCATLHSASGRVPIYDLDVVICHA